MPSQCDNGRGFFSQPGWLPSWLLADKALRQCAGAERAESVFWAFTWHGVVWH